MAFQSTSSEQMTTTTKESGLETNWKIKYGMRHSQQCYTLSNATLKLDPFD